MDKQSAMIAMIKGEKIVHPKCRGYFCLVEDKFFHMESGSVFVPTFFHEDGYEIKKEKVKKVKKEIDVFLNKHVLSHHDSLGYIQCKTVSDCLCTVPAKLTYEIEE